MSPVNDSRDNASDVSIQAKCALFFLYPYGFKLTLYLSRHVPAESGSYRSTGEYVSRPTTSLRRIVKTGLADTVDGLQSQASQAPNLRAKPKSETPASSPIDISSSESDNPTPKAKPAKKKVSVPSLGKQESGRVSVKILEPSPVTPRKGKEAAVDARKHIVSSPTASMSPPRSPQPSDKAGSVYLEDM